MISQEDSLLEKGRLASFFYTIFSKLLLGVILYSSLSLSACTKKASEYEPGDIAPDFSFTLSTGEKKKLSDYKGHVVLLSFWATWCDTCRGEIPDLKELTRQLGPKGLEVLGVIVNDAPANLGTFLSVNPLPYKTGYEEAQITSDLYKLTGVPEAFILDKEGRFVLFFDPATGDGATRILGPRQWSAKNIVSQFEKLLM